MFRTLKYNNVRIYYACLFALEFFVPLEKFSLISRRHHYDARLQILLNARHLWPLSNEGCIACIACHNYCDTGHLFIMVIYEDPSHSLIPNRLAVGLSLPVLTT